MNDLVILGAGGHAGVLADALAAAGFPVAGVIAPAPPAGSLLEGIPWLGDDAILVRIDPALHLLVNGVGSISDTTARQDLFRRATRLGFRFFDLFHPSAVLSRRGTGWGNGLQLLAGAVVGPGVRLGENVLINTRAVVEHDCDVGNHTHIATGAVVCGGCRIGNGVHIGAGAVIRQKIAIGDEACVAAGAVVVKDVASRAIVMGIPARESRKIEP